MSIRQKAIKGVVWSAIQTWGSQAGSLIVFFILARLLTPEDFGLVSLANVFLVFMQLLLEQGFAQALIQREDLEPEHLDTAFWTNLALGVLLTITGVALSRSAAQLFSQPDLTPILQCFSICFTLSAFSRVQQAILERKFDYKAIAVRSLLATAVGGCVGISLAWLGFGVWSLVCQHIVHEGVGAIVLWMASEWRPRFKVSKRHFRDLFGFGINIFGFNVLNFFNTRLTDFLIGYFLGTTALGYYSIAYRILTVMTQLLVRTIRDVSLPAFSRLQDDPEQFRKAFYTVTQLTSLVAFPTFLGMATLAPELVLTLFGARWLPSVPLLMQILAFAGMLRAVTFFKSSVFLAMGKPSWWLWLSVLNVVLNVISFTIALPWGINAIALAYVIRCYVAFPVGQWAVSKLIQTPLLSYLQQFVAPLISSLIMAVVILRVKQLLSAWSPLALLVVCTLVGAVVYGLAIRLLAPKLFQQMLGLARLALSKSSQQSA